MKTIIQLAFIGALLLSCKKNTTNNTNNQPPTQQNPPPNNSFPSNFKTANVRNGDGQVNGACWNHIQWGGPWNAHVYTQGSNAFIDSLNYVVTEPLPITIVDPTHFTFNTYTVSSNNKTNSPFIILSGTGTISNDTLVTVISAKTTTLNNCSNQNFTFNGRYRVLP